MMLLMLIWAYPLDQIRTFSDVPYVHPANYRRDKNENDKAIEILKTYGLPLFLLALVPSATKTLLYCRTPASDLPSSSSSFIFPLQKCSELRHPPIESLPCHAPSGFSQLFLYAGTILQREIN